MNMFLVFLNYFDVLISKIIFKKLKNIIGMYFGKKSYLKNNRNHTAKQALRKFTILDLIWSKIQVKLKKKIDLIKHK